MTNNRSRTRRGARGRFAPGSSGNTAGRPPGSGESFTACLRRRGAEPVPIDTPDGVQYVTRLDALALRLYELADAGSVRAAELIGNRLDGRPGQGTEPQPEPVFARLYREAQEARAGESETPPGGAGR